MDIQKERELFEEAMLRMTDGSFNTTKNHLTSQYTFGVNQTFWAVWQAAKAQSDKKIKLLLCDEHLQKCESLTGVFNSQYPDEEPCLICLAKQAKAQAVPEGFVLVKADNVDSFYQDDNEPENFCRSCDDLDALGDCMDRDEIMIVNKHTSAHISTEKFYGAWGVIETSYGTAWKFKLFNTEGEAKAAMIEAQEPAND